jgi:hypothetical protein
MGRVDAAKLEEQDMVGKNKEDLIHASCRARYSWGSNKLPSWSAARRIGYPSDELVAARGGNTQIWCTYIGDCSSVLTLYLLRFNTQGCEAHKRSALHENTYGDIGLRKWL